MTFGVTDLTVRYGSTVALGPVTLTISPGDVVGVIGGDGAGKSTLLKVMAGERLNTDGGISIPGATGIGFVPSAGGFFADLTVAENIAFVASVFGLNAWRARAEQLLGDAELSRFADRLAGQLSGGQQRKLAATMAVLPQPALLVLDEVTTGVDPVSRMALWRILGGAAADGAAVVIATTYLDEAERTNRVVLLEAGRVLAAGSPTEIERMMPGVVYSLDTPTDPATAWRHGRRWRQWRPAPARDPSHRPITPRLEDAAIVMELVDRGETKPGAERPTDGGDDRPPSGVRQVGRRRAGAPVTVAQACRVSHRYGSFLAVDGVDLTVAAGEVVGLIGANGAGKTTLIKMLLGVLAPTAGVLDVLGGPVGRAIRREIGYVPQHLGLYPDLTANENLAFRAAVYGVTPPATVSGAGDRLIGDVPLGVQRRVAFAAAVQHSPRLLILDEPTSGVSPLGRSELWDIIHDQADRGVGVLVSTHYMDEARQADRLAMLAHGRLVAHGTLDDVLDGRTVVNVEADDWAAAFAAVSGVGGWTRLDGRNVRVVGADLDDVRHALRGDDIRARVAVVPATLDEVLALQDGATIDAGDGR